MSSLKAALARLKNQQHRVAFESLGNVKKKDLQRRAFAIWKKSPKHWIRALNGMINIVTRIHLSHAFDRFKTHQRLSFEDEKRRNQKSLLELFGSEVVSASTLLSIHLPVMLDDDDIQHGFKVKALWGGGATVIRDSEWYDMVNYETQLPEEFVYETQVICNKNGRFHRVTLHFNLGTDDLHAFEATVGKCEEKFSYLVTELHASLPMLKAKGFEVVYSEPIEKDVEECWNQEHDVLAEDFNELIEDIIKAKRAVLVRAWHSICALKRSIIPTDD